MELSILVARILALTYMAAGFAALRGRVKFTQMVEDFERSPALTFSTGFFTLVLGVILVTYHNRWVNDWTVLVTIVGWLSLYKGIMLIAFPQALGAFKSWYQNTTVWGVLMFTLGLVFAVFGFLLN